MLCDKCDADPTRKARLGCLRAPMVCVDGVEREWSESWLREYASERELQPNVELATWFYEFADAGRPSRFLGRMWPCCPRSIVEFGAPHHAYLDSIAQLAIITARDIKRGMPSHLILGGEQPTPAMMRAIRLASDVLDTLEAEATRRAYEDAKKK